MEPLSIEDVVATSDAMVIRRRFDGRNLIWMTVLLVVFLFACIIELTADLVHHTSVDVAIAGSNTVLLLLFAFLLRDVYRAERKQGTGGSWGLGRWMRRHITGTTVAYLLVQYTLLIAFARKGENFAGWAFSFPFFMLGFRFLRSEIALLHIYLTALPVGLAYVNLRKDLPGVAIAFVVVNLICAAIELVVSMRFGREIAGDWGERRRQAREQIRMRDELQYARQLQVSMLPECAPSLDWIDVAGASVPATEVGGDYFDYFMVGDALAIVEGDVAGHGMASGIVLASLRSGFTLLREALVDPAAVLQRLHDLVAETSRRRILVTCAVLLLDPVTRRARIASAGHPPLIVRSNGSTTAVNLYGPPLGVRLLMTIAQNDQPFGPGDVFVLHTDGVYESASPEGESYGIERIVDVVRSCAAEDATAIRDAILHDVETFRAGEPASDDVTVVVARISG